MNRVVLSIMLILVFSIGYLSANPAVFSKPAEAAITSFQGKAIERISPQNHVDESQIIVLSDKIVLDIKDASWTTFTDTNSMDPVLDTGANGIQIEPKSVDDVKVGDIITYKSEYGLIIHRVVKTGYDESGWYAFAKGDNNPLEDPEKIRFDQIHGVLVAVIY